MKRIAAAFLSLCMAFSLCACGGSDQVVEKTLKIGVFEPSTGGYAPGGQKEILGIQYANAQTPTLTLNGETYRVELVYADSGSTAEEASAAASYLAGEDVSLVIGSYGSDLSLAGGPVFEAAGIPVIGASCTNPAITAGNDYYFRLCYTDDFQAGVLASFAGEKLGGELAYCLGESGSTYDQDLIAFFKAAFEAAGGTVITDAFPGGCTDFSAYLNRAVSESADVIFIPVSSANAIRLLTQAASLDIDAPFLGPDTLDDAAVLEAVSGTGLRLYVSTYYREGSSAEFEEGFREYVNADPEALAANGGSDAVSAVSAMGYDAYYVALEAVKKARSAGKADILAILPSVTYSGITGSIVFDETGDTVRTAAYIKSADTANAVWKHETVQTGAGK